MLPEQVEMLSALHLDGLPVDDEVEAGLVGCIWQPHVVPVREELAHHDLFGDVAAKRHVSTRGLKFMSVSREGEGMREIRCAPEVRGLDHTVVNRCRAVEHFASRKACDSCGIVKLPGLATMRRWGLQVAGGQPSGLRKVTAQPAFDPHDTLAEVLALGSTEMDEI
jgi:hypothetical protein